MEVMTSLWCRWMLLQNANRIRCRLSAKETLRSSITVSVVETVQLYVLGLIDHAHAPAAGLFDDAVVRDMFSEIHIEIQPKSPRICAEECSKLRIGGGMRTLLSTLRPKTLCERRIIPQAIAFTRMVGSW